MIVRSLRLSDLDEILRIEQEAMTAPWSAAQLRAEAEAGNGVGLVAECEASLCGYAFFRTCVPECELLHLVVAPSWRRQGVGEAMLQHAFVRFSGQGVTACFLEVRCSNEAARHLYAKVGFLQVGKRKQYYRQPVEDAWQLCWNFIESK